MDADEGARKDQEGAADDMATKPLQGTSKKEKASLESMSDEELAYARRTGQIDDKELKKAGFSEEKIKEIKDAASDQAAKIKPGGHDRKKVIDDTTGSKKAEQLALEEYRRNPNEENLQKLEEARRQSTEINIAKHKTDVERRRRNRSEE